MPFRQYLKITFIFVLSVMLVFSIVLLTKTMVKDEVSTTDKGFKTIDAPEPYIEKKETPEPEVESRRSSPQNPDKENAEVFILTTVGNKTVKCSYARMTNCGVVLKKCDDGKDYYCLQGVIVP